MYLQDITQCPTNGRLKMHLKCHGGINKTVRTKSSLIMMIICARETCHIQSCLSGRCHHRTRWTAPVMIVPRWGSHTPHLSTITSTYNSTAKMGTIWIVVVIAVWGGRKWSMALFWIGRSDWNLGMSSGKYIHKDTIHNTSMNWATSYNELKLLTQHEECIGSIREWEN
jgi:hypothetical protein